MKWMHTYADFLSVSKKHVIEDVWLERATVVEADGLPEATTIGFIARLPDGSERSLAEQLQPGLGDMQLSPASAGLLQESGAFGTDEIAFEFRLTSPMAPAAAIRIDADFRSEARPR